MNYLDQLRELEKLGNSMIRLAAEEWDQHWKILISTIMSARTRDEVTIRIANNLFKKYPTVEKLAKAELKEIEKIIKPVNFYKNKTKKGIEEDLKKLFHKSIWKEINPILVRFGKTYTSRKKKDGLLEKIKSI